MKTPWGYSDFDGGARIDWAEIEVTEWKDFHRARIYRYSLIGLKDGNSKYFAEEN